MQLSLMDNSKLDMRPSVQLVVILLVLFVSSVWLFTCIVHAFYKFFMYIYRFSKEYISIVQSLGARA
ncbi:unnamed protein product [Soboliphyme baturini]|uniref:Small hydrophobic protein n=1 Tax=Soboliphyme baturini TaxID=241478 RepID=A0A183IDM6_9BILA|nr:unnamed protein product [Soboliphyme baturini]